MRRLRLAICGPGRVGKDTAAIWLAQNTSLQYQGSTSEAAAKLCYERLKDRFGYENIDTAFARRHEERRAWAEVIWDYNQPDGITLYAEMLQTSDILNGIRRKAELDALKTRGLIDLVIWIDRTVPADPSLEMAISDADLIIPNHWTVDVYYERLTRLAKALGVYVGDRKCSLTLVVSDGKSCSAH